MTKIILEEWVSELRYCGNCMHLEPAPDKVCVRCFFPVPNNYANWTPRNDHQTD